MFNIFRTVSKSVWLIVIGHAVTDLSPGALLVALPFLKAKFALTYAEVSAIVLVQNFTSSISQPVFGYFSDRNPRPWLMPAGCLICGLAMLAVLVVPNYYLVLVAIGLSGLGNAAFHPEAAKTANSLSGQAKGKGISLFSVGGSIGFAFGSLVLTALIAGGVGAKLFLYILPFLITSAALYFLATKLTYVVPQKRGSMGALKSTISWPLLALLGMVLTRATVSSGLNTFLPLYYVSYLHGSEVYASFLLTVYLLAGAIGTLVGGAMSDKYGSKKVMLYSILPISLTLYLFQMVDGIGVLVVLSITSILLSATFTSSLVMTQKMMPHNVGMASGLTLGFSVGLGTMGVLALGKVADVWGMPFVFEILAILPIIGFILTLFVCEPAENENVTEAAR